MSDNDKNGSKAGVWIFRILILAAAVFIVYVWLMPWWTIDVEELGKDIVQIRPWGLEIDERMGSFVILLQGADMPVWFGPFMWSYLGLSMVALLVAAFIRGKEFLIGKFKVTISQFLIGGVGFSYIIVAIVMAIYASIRMKGFFNTPLQGLTSIDLGDSMHSYAETRLTLGYWLIYVSGLFTVLLAVFQKMIIGKSETDK